MKSFEPWSVADDRPRWDPDSHYVRTSGGESVAVVAGGHERSDDHLHAILAVPEMLGCLEQLMFAPRDQRGGTVLLALPPDLFRDVRFAYLLARTGDRDQARQQVLRLMEDQESEPSPEEQKRRREGGKDLHEV